MSRQLFRIHDAAQTLNQPQTDSAALDPDIERQKLDAAAAEERVRLRQIAVESGHEQGYQAGYAAGLAAGKADLAEFIKEIKSQALKLDTELANLAPMVVTHVVDLGIRLAETLTGSPTLFDRASALAALLTDVRELAPPRTRIGFRIHPETLALLDQAILTDIDVVADPSLRQGGGIFEVVAVETKQIMSRLDATIERRLETLESVRGFRSVASGTP